MVSEWGVRFTFAVGSACFLFGSAFAIVEIINEEDPLLPKSSIRPWDSPLDRDGVSFANNAPVAVPAAGNVPDEAI